MSFDTTHEDPTAFGVTNTRWNLASSISTHTGGKVTSHAFHIRSLLLSCWSQPCCDDQTVHWRYRTTWLDDLAQWGLSKNDVPYSWLVFPLLMAWMVTRYLIFWSEYHLFCAWPKSNLQSLQPAEALQGTGFPGTSMGKADVPHLRHETNQRNIAMDSYG